VPTPAQRFLAKIKTETKNKTCQILKYIFLMDSSILNTPDQSVKILLNGSNAEQTFWLLPLPPWNNVLMKHKDSRFLPTKLHGVTSQKTAIQHLPQ
jgi:hypothetical protein